MGTETKTNDTKSFRTAKCIERTKRAAELVSSKRATFEAATRESEEADALAADDPSEKNFTAAREKRRARDDAARDLELADAHASKVENEVCGAEHAAIRKEIARRETALTVVDDEDMRALSVEIAVRCVELRTSTEARAGQRREELEAINALRARVGAKTEDVPYVDKMMGEAWMRLAELGLSAQAQAGLRSNSFGLFPSWKEGAAAGPKEFREDNCRPTVSGTYLDPGTGQLVDQMHGRDGTAIVAEAKRLLDRRAGKSSQGVASKVAAATAAVVLSALALGGSVVGG